jgi:hypothetical protein
MPRGQAAGAVMLEHPGGTAGPVDIDAGGGGVFGAPYPTLTVSEADVAAGEVVARFAVPALRLSAELRYETATGRARN